MEAVWKPCGIFCVEWMQNGCGMSTECSANCSEPPIRWNYADSAVFSLYSARNRGGTMKCSRSLAPGVQWDRIRAVVNTFLSC